MPAKKKTTAKKKTPTKKKKMGRPTTYKPEYCEMLVEHMRQGFNFETFAAKLNYQSKSSLYKWLDKHEEFKKAKQVGEALAELWWLNLGRTAAAGKVPGFNATVWIFTMKNMFRWRDKHPDENHDRMEPLIIDLPMSDKSIQISGGKK